ncbi:LysR family transcriptional regulator [Phyllobacterium sp. OV277]|uniref:LysR family transcriptional regulator n=1 Tax=Phyllobacterium sp. OV277 TaxID=1882772 RepID=UPI00087F03FE|nr:LysR family transcriptional regulator [Phyllobacterium sp. OV277]SDP39587.1 DNA-binding transcriptional regulator, LysR family [Phyllobacterium sp. OV277]
MLNRAIDPVLMDMLVCLAEEGSFTGAAERMHLSQQAISAQVKRLEGLVGQQIVTRSHQDICLTTSGETLLIYARQVLGIAERIRRQFSAVKLEGSVRFGFTPGFGLPMLFPLLTEIRRVHPRLELLCETGRTINLISKLDAGTLDVIIGAQQEGNKRGETLLREKLLWVGNAEQILRENTPVPLVMLPRPTFLRDHIFQLLDNADMRWTVFFESDDVMAARAAVQSGWGISLFNRVLLSGDEALATDLAQKLLPDAGHVEFFLRHNSRGNETIKSFADVLRSVIRDL